jgi:bifunctional non-homologous end joining protein LigD
LYLQSEIMTKPEGIDIPMDAGEYTVKCQGKEVQLTNLTKVFWPEERITKRDLLLYYASVAPVLLPHLKNRAVVMKRYPNGIHEAFFFMKRTPANAPKWLETCAIPHRSGNVIDFPMAQDLASLLWLINLGCIDLNQWYATCDDVHRPDYLHFDLDPVAPASIDDVSKAALLIRDYMAERGVATLPKTSGSRGIHIYIPIVRGPLQKEVWRVAKRVAGELAAAHPELLTSVYRIAERPPGRILVDYNQNSWGRTLASVYSARPKPGAPVSMPLRWEEVERGIRMERFHIRNAKQRIDEVGDLFLPLLRKKSRTKLESLK